MSGLDSDKVSPWKLSTSGSAMVAWLVGRNILYGAGDIGMDLEYCATPESSVSLPRSANGPKELLSRMVGVSSRGCASMVSSSLVDASECSDGPSYSESESESLSDNVGKCGTVDRGITVSRAEVVLMFPAAHCFSRAGVGVDNVWS